MCQLQGAVIQSEMLHGKTKYRSINQPFSFEKQIRPPDYLGTSMIVQNKTQLKQTSVSSFKGDFSQTPTMFVSRNYFISRLTLGTLTAPVPEGKSRQSYSSSVDPETAKEKRVTSL